LPPGYYAMPEQHAGKWIADVLTLQIPAASIPPVPDDGGVAVADAPPKVRQKLTSSPKFKGVAKFKGVGSL